MAVTCRAKRVRTLQRSQASPFKSRSVLWSSRAPPLLSRLSSSTTTLLRFTSTRSSERFQGLAESWRSEVVSELSDCLCSSTSFAAGSLVSSSHSFPPPLVSPTGSWTFGSWVWRLRVVFSHGSFRLTSDTFPSTYLYEWWKVLRRHSTLLVSGVIRCDSRH